MARAHGTGRDQRVQAVLATLDGVTRPEALQAVHQRHLADPAG